MKTSIQAAVIAMTFSASMAHADAVTDALSAAGAAYASGQLGQTAAQLTNATRALQALQQERLAKTLPVPPDGWTLTQSQDDMNAAAMFGGAVGTIASGSYNHSDGRSFTVTLTADSPMVASMAGMLGSPQMMAMMGPVVKVGTVDMLNDGASLSAMIANRVLVQAQGAEAGDMISILSAMDFARLANFDQ